MKSKIFEQVKESIMMWDGDYNYLDNVVKHILMLTEHPIDPVVESVTRKFARRSNIGIKKYGTTLAENNKDDFFVHLEEELYDAINYLEKLKTMRHENTSKSKTDPISKAS